MTVPPEGAVKLTSNPDVVDPLKLVMDGADATVAPSRMTVTESHRSMTSSSRWLM